jgi:Tol biopolymer transport system component
VLLGVLGPRRSVRLATVGLAALVALAAGRGARAAGEPDPYEEAGTTAAPELGPIPVARWLTLETQHFRIHFYGDEWQFALHAATVAERAYRLNTRYLNWQPSGRVDITLNDQTDGANGFASSLPHNFVFAYGAPPQPLDELNDFDDFVKLLITHEFTHVVHLDTIIGAPRILNSVFGKIYAPNLSQPNWFIEGLAVLMESRQTTGGRVRSSFYDMHLRVPFLEGSLLGLDAVSNGPLVYPQGTAAYLYGSSMLKYIEDRYGPVKLREISHRYGSLLIPGGINRVAGEAVGLGYEEIWEDWKRSLSHKYALEVDEAQRRGLTPIERLTWEPPGTRGEGMTPRFARDGTLVYHRESNDRAPAYVRLNLDSGAKTELRDIHSGGSASPTPDGRGIVFQQTAFQALKYRISGASHVSWDDLFLYDLETGNTRPLTRGRRAHEPDVSPDGTLVACTVTSQGRRDLAVVPVAGGEPQILTGDLAGFAYTPAWSPDGRLIAYSRWKPGGFRDIHIYDFAARTDHALWVDRAMDMDPRFSPDGRFVLLSSDRTGISNIFAYELATGTLYQVTNVLAGAFQPAVSPDRKRLVFTGFTSDGFDLFAAAYDPARFQLAQPSANARLDASRIPEAEADSPDAAPEDAAAPPAVERITSYHPWKYLYPHTWTLSYLSDPLGLGSSGQVTTSFGDPVGDHAVAVNVTVPRGGDASVRLDYIWSGLWPQLALSLTRTALMAGDLIMDGSYVAYLQHAETASASIGVPYLRRAESSGDFSFGYNYLRYGPANRLPVADPTRGITIAPETGPDANLFLSWAYSNVHAWTYSISGQEGRRLQLSLQISSPELGSKFHTTNLGWAWTEYKTPPWARLHALALLYSGGVGIGDKRGVFALGGFVDQDLVRSLFLNRRQCCLFLRGYPAGSLIGDQFHLLSAEYRAPLYIIEQGYTTFPLYLRRVSGAAFVDAGNAFSGSFRPGDVKVGVGGELRVELNLVYYLATELQLGVARGLMKEGGGGTQVYFVSAFPF